MHQVPIGPKVLVEHEQHLTARYRSSCVPLGLLEVEDLSGQLAFSDLSQGCQQLNIQSAEFPWLSQRLVVSVLVIDLQDPLKRLVRLVTCGSYRFPRSCFPRPAGFGLGKFREFNGLGLLDFGLLFVTLGFGFSPLKDSSIAFCASMNPAKSGLVEDPGMFPGRGAVFEGRRERLALWGSVCH